MQAKKICGLPRNLPETHGSEPAPETSRNSWIGTCPRTSRNLRPGSRPQNRPAAYIGKDPIANLKLLGKKPSQHLSFFLKKQIVFQTKQKTAYFVDVKRWFPPKKPSREIFSNEHLRGGFKCF